MELLRLGAGWPCGVFDAVQSRQVALIARPSGGRAERCVIVTGYLRTKFFETDLINEAPLLEPKYFLRMSFKTRSEMLSFGQH